MTKSATLDEVRENERYAQQHPRSSRIDFAAIPCARTVGQAGWLESLNLAKVMLRI